MNAQGERLVRTAFLAGAVTDAGARLPMLLPRLEKLWKLDGAGIFEPRPGRPMREYLAAPHAMLDDRKLLLSWVSRALPYGTSLKPKSKTAKKTAQS
jgi:hypothetical protein